MEAIAQAAHQYVESARSPLMVGLLETTVALCVERVKR